MYTCIIIHLTSIYIVLTFYSSALTFEISRPLKLTLTNKLIEKLSDFSDSILKSIGDHRGMETAPTAEYESDCMQEPLQEVRPSIHTQRKCT